MRLRPADGPGRRHRVGRLVGVVFAAVVSAPLVAVPPVSAGPGSLPAFVMEGAAGWAGPGRMTAAALAMRAGVAISQPTSVNLGSRPTGSASLSASLGTVTVSDTRGLVVLGSWTATVSSTNFITGGGTANETILKTNIAYASLGATATSGIGAFTPGQATIAQAQSLSVTRTAFTGTLLLLNNSASWDPTIVVTLPAAAVAGTYTATITHSVS